MPLKDLGKRREYQKLYHKKTWQQRRQKHIENKNLRRRALAKWLLEYKLGLKCSNCSENDPRCLDFDHQGNKFKAVSTLVSEAWSKKRVMDEIAKCKVLCANCHRKKTFNLGIV